jgi:cGMP-dependent protein kinase
MGNKNLKNISITNFPINKDNNFIKTPTDIEKLKEGMKEEKKNLKTISKQNKSLKDYTLLENCLKNHPILYFLDKNAMKEIIQQMSQYESNENLEIFTQGATPWFFLILSEGTCDLYYNGEKFDTKESGECLDDLSLIYDCNRIYTVKTSTKCKFWGLGRKNFKKILELINNVTFDEKYNKTSSLALFSFNDKNIKNKIIYNLNKEKRNAGNQIIKREHITNCLYYIEQGQVDIKFDDYVIDTLHEGDYFGELSIFFNTNRIFDYVAKDNCFIYSLPIGHMNNISDNYRMEILFSLLKAAFLKVEKFKNINHKFFNEIFDLFEFQYFGKEQIILQKEFLISSYIIIPIEGCLFLEEERSLICKRGDLLFGEYLFDLNNSPINYNIKCKLHSLLLLADTNQVLQRIGCTFKDYIEKYSPINQLKQVKLFKNLTTEKINEIFEKIKIKKISNGNNLVNQGENGSEFFIIKKGIFDMYIDDKYIRSLNENEYFGERALFFNEKNSETAKAKGDCEVFYLEKSDFDNIIKNELKEFLLNRLYLQDDKIQLEDLYFYKSLGVGTYGLVSLVKNKKNNYFYAIKNISKKQILSCKLMNNIEMEKSILLKIDHPFIVKLVKTLKDEKYIYYLMDYLKGKELFSVIRDIGLLNKEQAQFYIASIILAVNYLHQKKIIFRDIKPENIMVLENGYIKLIDFGTAKELKDKTNSIIGTPHYMAPEVILGDLYSFEIDYWSIGICLYEFCCGILPFGDNEEDPLNIYMAVLNE